MNPPTGKGGGDIGGNRPPRGGATKGYRSFRPRRRPTGQPETSMNPPPSGSGSGSAPPTTPTEPKKVEDQKPSSSTPSEKEIKTFLATLGRPPPSLSSFKKVQNHVPHISYLGPNIVGDQPPSYDPLTMAFENIPLFVDTDQLNKHLRGYDPPIVENTPLFDPDPDHANKLVGGYDPTIVKVEDPDGNDDVEPSAIRPSRRGNVSSNEIKYYEMPTPRIRANYDPPYKVTPFPKVGRCNCGNPLFGEGDLCRPCWDKIPPKLEDD